MDIESLLSLGRFEFNEWRRANREPVRVETRDLARVGRHESESSWRRSTADFSGYDFTEWTFVGCDMHGVDFSGALFEGATLDHCTLTNASLSNARLESSRILSCDLTDCEAAGAVLDGATIEHSWMRKCNLDSSYLRGTTLRVVDLSLSRLTGTRLSQAHLEDVDLHRCSLGDCDFTGATWKRVSVADCDLRPVVGLNSIEHEGTSSVATDTVLRSRGDVPRSFLVQSGIDSIVVDYLLEAATASTRNPLFEFQSVFLSHSSADKPLVNEVYNYLVDAGVPCWLDEKQMFPGDRLHAHISRAIRGADRHAVFFSRKMLESWWVNQEIEMMMDEEQRRSRIGRENSALVIPVDVDGALFDDSLTEPWLPAMRQRVAARFAERSTRALDLDRLLAALRRGGPSRPFPGVFDPN